MGTKFLQIVLLIIATQFIFGSSCNKDDSKPCRDARYSFNVTSEFYPQKEIYNVGDTIFLTSTLPKTLTDLISNQQVDYSNSLGIGGDIGFALPDSITKNNRPARDSFALISILGTFIERNSNQNQGINNLYVEENNYLFKGAIVCKKKGIYAISVDNLISKGIKGNDCTNATFNMKVVNTNKHTNLYESTLGIVLDQYSKDKIYCFKVE